MHRKRSLFQMEAAGSLTPELEGAPASGRHPRTTKEKGRGEQNDEARKKEEQTFLEKDEG